MPTRVAPKPGELAHAGRDPNFTTPDHIIAGAVERSAVVYAPGEGSLEWGKAIDDKQPPPSRWFR